MSNLPQDYDVPSSSGNYMKLEKGTNKFRILGDILLGWKWWTETEDGKSSPVRIPYDQSPPVSAAESVKHFWAFPVWNYAANKLQVLEITQKGIQRDLRALDRNPKWGEYEGYDITVEKKGEDLATTYSVVPEPPSALESEIKKAVSEAKINLEALFDNDDPFADSEVATEEVEDDFLKSLGAPGD